MKKGHLEAISEALIAIEGTVDAMASVTDSLQAYRSASEDYLRAYKDHNEGLNQRVFALRSLIISIEQEYEEEEAITGIRDRVNRLASKLKGSKGDEERIDTEAQEVL